MRAAPVVSCENLSSETVRIEHRAEAAGQARKLANDQLQSGVSWLEELLRGVGTKDRLVTALEVVATALEHDELSAAM